MRSLLQLWAILFFVSALHAQDVDLPAQSTSPEPSTTPSPAPTPIATPADLIPPNILPAPAKAPAPPAPSVPTIPQLDEGFKVGPISQPAENRRLHAEWRRLRNKVENDPEIRAARVIAEKAKTDLEKRKLLRRYYELLYAKLNAIAEPDFRPYLENRKREVLAMLPQPRVRPEAPPTAKKK